MTLGWMAEHKGNPSLVPAGHWIGMIVIDLVLLIVDLWCINGLFNWVRMR